MSERTVDGHGSERAIAQGSERSERAAAHSSTVLDRYDALLVDLDGTLFRGARPISGAAQALAGVRAAGCPIGYVTNNASRSPEQVTRYLAQLGFQVGVHDIVTSSQAAARLLTEHLEPGAAVLVVGTDALAEQVDQAGLRPVRRAEDEPAAVVQGHSADTGWRELCEACLALRAGALWVACNVDPTLPTEHGLLPGNGAMVAALRTATEREPLVAGKPARPLVDEAVRRIGARNPLVAGDRLDTDIAGAVAADLHSLLVLTGVSDAAAVLAAPAEQRPTYLAADLAGLAAPSEELRPGERDGWRVRRHRDGLELSGRGEPLDALRALCALHWAGAGGQVAVHADGADAQRALAALGLTQA